MKHLFRIGPDSFYRINRETGNYMDRTWVASGRNGYYAVDEYHTGSTAVWGHSLIFDTRGTADRVAAALNAAYMAGQNDQAQTEVTALSVD